MSFADFWNDYCHPKNRGSKAEAEELYNKLTLDDRVVEGRARPRYKAYVAETEWYNPMQARRWLNKKKKNWLAWAEAAEGEDADMSQLKRETEALKERNRRRQEAADEKWRDRYERQFGHRPT